jgi:3-oxoacyl-[acyl-carrier-protein] synthase II
VARGVRLALADAEVAPADLDCLSASASGSVEVDRREALGVAAALGERAADLPVTAVKSMLGEAMGAAGGLQVVALLGTFADGVLPGIRGLDEVAERLPLGGLAAGARQVRARRALVTALSADGHAAALVLGARRATFRSEGEGENRSWKRRAFVRRTS